MEKRRLLVKTIGALFLAIGLFSLFLVPAEFTSFYAFTEGGNFHYEGFGFGSLMFAFIILNVIAYFIFAVSGIFLGIGNLSLKKWGLDLSLAFFKTLFVIGITTVISFLLSFGLIKNLKPYQSIVIVTFLLVSLIVLPFVFMKFYKNPKTAQLFKSPTSKNIFEEKSSDGLTVILLNLVWIVFFYVLVVLKGSFPLFGNFVFKREGTFLLSMAIFILLILTYLFYINKHYAHFVMIGYYVVLLFAFTLTFLRYTTSDYSGLLDLPSYELGKIVPAFWIPAGLNLGIFFGVLITIQIYLILKEKKVG